MLCSGDACVAVRGGYLVAIAVAHGGLWGAFYHGGAQWVVVGEALTATTLVLLGAMYPVEYFVAVRRYSPADFVLLTRTVWVFDATLLGMGLARLAFVILAPGDTSPASIACVSVVCTATQVSVFIFILMAIAVSRRMRPRKA